MSSKPAQPIQKVSGQAGLHTQQDPGWGGSDENVRKRMVTWGGAVQLFLRTVMIPQGRFCGATGSPCKFKPPALDTNHSAMPRDCMEREGARQTHESSQPEISIAKPGTISPATVSWSSPTRPPPNHPAKTFNSKIYVNVYFHFLMKKIEQYLSV